MDQSFGLLARSQISYNLIFVTLQTMPLTINHHQKAYKQAKQP